MEKLDVKTITLNGLSVSWYQSKKILENRKSLLFIHGIASQGKHWIPLINNFQYSYNVFVLDRPGYGKSDSIEGISIKEYTAFLKEVISKMNIPEPYIYIGHSMGAYLGLSLSIENVVFEKLILLSPFIKYVPSKRMLSDPKSCKELVCKSISHSFSKNTDKSLINSYLQDVNEMSDITIWNDFNMISYGEIKKDFLSCINSYVYIIHTLDDHVVSIRKSHTISQCLCKSELYNIDFGGHNFFIAFPQAARNSIEYYIWK